MTRRKLLKSPTASSSSTKAPSSKSALQTRSAICPPIPSLKNFSISTARFPPDPGLRKSDGTVTRHRTAFRAQWATRPSRGQRFVIYDHDTRYFTVFSAAMDKATHPFVLELLDSYRKVGGLN